MDDDRREAATDIVRMLRDAGYSALFAGGCVRDRLLGEIPHDYDIATSARPEEIVRLFPGRAKTVGAHFGVVLVGRANFDFDVATYREDGAYSDNRHPDRVIFSNARRDALRRDFTINGLFEDPLTGEVIDYVGGREDIERRLVRAIGNPDERFREDALRLMRAVRFATVKDFAVEQETSRSIAANAGLLRHVSEERIRAEFDRILVSPHRRRGVEILVDSGLMNGIMPEVTAMIGCEQPPEFHPEGDVYTHTMIMLGCLAEDASLELVLAVLLHDIGKPCTASVDDSGRLRFSGHAAAGARIAADMLRRLKYPNRTIAVVTDMVARHMDFMNITRMRQSTLRRFIAAPFFGDELELHRVDCLSSHGSLDHYQYALDALEGMASEPVLPPPLVGGRDLIEMGYVPGRAFSEMLAWAFNEQLENPGLTRDQLLEGIAARYPLDRR